MTLWDVFRVMPRRWYVVVVGLLCTALAFQAIEHRQVIFYSRAQIVFLAPASTLYPNVLSSTSLDLIITAGVVGKLLNGTATLAKVSSMEATMVGRGVRDGVVVQLPDNGGQWSASYDTRALDVQVAAATADLVRERQADVFQRIDENLTALQDELNVDPINRITTEVVPATPTIRLMAGQPRRGQAMTLLLGGALTLMAIAELEIRSARRRGLAVRDPLGAPNLAW